MHRFLIIIFLISAQYAQDVVFWEPEIPVPGGEVIIYYNTFEGTLPDDTNPVYIHLGYNGWQNTNDYAMTLAPDIGDGWWSYGYSIPEDAETIDFVFTDLQGNWDNNGGFGIDWHISLNYYWTPYFPGPDEVVTIFLNNVDQGGEIVWTVEGGDGHELPIEEYWPEGSYLEDGVLFSPLSDNGLNSLAIELGPFLSGEQVVFSMKFKIRWEDGSWDVGSNGQVMYYDIYIDYSYEAGDPYVFFGYPTPDEGEEVEGSVPITVVGTAQFVEFWANGEWIGTDDTSPFETTWSPDPNSFGESTIIAIAFGENGRVTFLFRTVYLLFTIVEEPVPDGVDDGVNIDGNTVTFALYAPYKDYVAIKGSWNTQYPNGELMSLSGDTLWWYQTDLPDGDYTYQYNLTGEKLIADPWSKDVTWVDPGGGWESWNYEHAKTAFVVGEPDFVWNDQDFIRPEQEEVIAYELHLGDFKGDSEEFGTYQDVIAKLNEGYFNDLGITAIELMPVNEFEGAQSWGYNPSYYLAPESSYGTPSEFKQLVDVAHQNGIAVLLDVVFNHMWGSAPLFQLYQPVDSWDYEDHDYDHCPYFHNQESLWGYKLQHWHEVDGRKYRTCKYVSDALLSWVNDYHMDGFRFDVTWGIGWGGDENGASFYADLLDDINPSIILIAEEDNPSQVNNSDFDAGWDFSYHHSLFNNLMEISLNMYDLRSNLQWWTQGWTSHTAGLNYTVSHDETRLIYEATHYQGMSLPEAYQKSKLGAVVLLTGTGTPMLYHGQEFGQNSPVSLSSQPLQWDNLGTPEGQDLFQHYQRLIWFRKNWDVIRGPNLEITYLDNSQKIIAFKRNDDDFGQTVFVVMNFNSSNQTISNLEFPYAGDWYEFTMDDTLYTSDGNYSDYEIPTSKAKVYTNYKNWPDLGVDYQINALPVEFSLKQNHPNPFNAATRITFSLPEDGDVSLIIYDLLGRRVRELVSGKWRTGVYQMQWDGKDDLGQPVSSGVYLYSLKTSRHSATKKLLMLK